LEIVMKSRLAALVGAILVSGSSAPLIAGDLPFYIPVPHPVTNTAAAVTGAEPAPLDWTAMIGTGGKTKPSSSAPSAYGTALDWTSKIGTGGAADSNAGSKAIARAAVVLARSGRRDAK